MKYRSAYFLPVLAATCFFLSGCTTPIPPGTPVQDIITKNGPPSAEYKDGDVRILEWSVGEEEAFAYMAKVGPDDKLISYENVRTNKKFAQIRINQFTKQDVLKTVGHPSETEYLPLIGQETWTYRYREDDIWHSMMHIFFDTNGVVQRMENGPDPLYIPE